jgi:hypothetical protein
MKPRTVPRKPQASVEVLVRGLPPGIASLLADLQALVGTEIPEATAKPNMGWKSLNFHHPQVGYFCGLFPFKDRIDVAFEFGVLLPDPEGLLEFRGKQVGFIQIRSRADIRRVPLKGLIRAAVSLPGDRSARLALVRSGAKPVAPRQSRVPDRPSEAGKREPAGGQ